MDKINIQNWKKFYFNNCELSRLYVSKVTSKKAFKKPEIDIDKSTFICYDGFTDGDLIYSLGKYGSNNILFHNIDENDSNYLNAKEYGKMDSTLECFGFRTNKYGLVYVETSYFKEYDRYTDLYFKNLDVNSNLVVYNENGEQDVPENYLDKFINFLQEDYGKFFKVDKVSNHKWVVKDREHLADFVFILYKHFNNNEYKNGEFAVYDSGENRYNIIESIKINSENDLYTAIDNMCQILTTANRSRLGKILSKAADDFVIS